MKPIIGWREWVVLPLLHRNPIKAKIDTGARTSALHAARIRPLQVNGADWVEFELDRRDLPNASAPFRVPLSGQRTVRNSGGRAEERYLIETMLRLGDDEWPVELTLTARHAMSFPLLIGRTAVRRRFVVDPGRSYLLAKRTGKRRNIGRNRAY
ncbi:MAG: RimK/LysX family protein [Gammaproteobacteria bacterium]|nr:RimK/LysX family protein [Gammaproteobacteria bacterium]MDE0365236.1 RimK/LysX family protein [Gammaproteobacteria bacterium]